jgi:plasminogen
MGEMSRTRKGITCQRWDANWTNDISAIKLENIPDATISDAANYCRDPDGLGAPWCYTMDPEIRWHWCCIPDCNNVGMYIAKYILIWFID